MNHPSVFFLRRHVFGLREFRQKIGKDFNMAGWLFDIHDRYDPAKLYFANGSRERNEVKRPDHEG